MWWTEPSIRRISSSMRPLMWYQSDPRSTDPATDIITKLSLWKWCNRHTRVWSELVPQSLVLQAAYSAVLEFSDGTAAGSSPLTPVPCQGFELIRRDAARFEIGLEAVPEPQLSTNAACTVSQLSVQRSLWHSFILHAYYMAGPPKLCCHEESLDASDLTTFEYTGVGSHFLPFDIGYFPQTSQVELLLCIYATNDVMVMQNQKARNAPLQNCLPSLGSFPSPLNVYIRILILAFLILCPIE